MANVLFIDTVEFTICANCTVCEMHDFRNIPVQYHDLEAAANAFKAERGTEPCVGPELILTARAHVFVYGGQSLLEELLARTIILPNGVTRWFCSYSPSQVVSSGLAADNGWTHYVALFPSNKFMLAQGTMDGWLHRTDARYTLYPVIAVGTLL